MKRLRQVRPGKGKIAAMTKKLLAVLQKKGVSDSISAEPLTGHYNLPSGGYGADVEFVRVHDLDSGDWYDIYHTETGLPHPLKPPASQLEPLMKELNRLKDPDYDDALDVIGKYQQKSSKIVKVESKGTAMQLSKLNEMVEDAFDLEEGYTRSDILKLTKMVAKKAANMIRKEHAAFVKKHKLDTKGGGGLAGSEADASWEDFMEMLSDELENEGIMLDESIILSEAMMDEKDAQKVADAMRQASKYYSKEEMSMGFDILADEIEEEIEDDGESDVMGNARHFFKGPAKEQLNSDQRREFERIVMNIIKKKNFKKSY